MHVYISALYLSSCPEINDMLFLCLKQMNTGVLYAISGFTVYL